MMLALDLLDDGSVHAIRGMQNGSLLIDPAQYLLALFVHERDSGQVDLDGLGWISLRQPNPLQLVDPLPSDFALQLKRLSDWRPSELLS